MGSTAFMDTNLMGVTLLEMTGPMKQPTPMAAKRRPSVVELSPKLCMLGKVLKRTCAACRSAQERAGHGGKQVSARGKPAQVAVAPTCRLSEAPHTTAPLAFMKVIAAASLHATMSWLDHVYELVRLATNASGKAFNHAPCSTS